MTKTQEEIIMMLFSLVGLFIFLFWIRYTTIEKWQLDQGAELCQRHGGIYKFTSLDKTRVWCMDGENFVPLRPGE